MDSPDQSEEPNLNTGTPWSSWDDQDIRWGLDENHSIEEMADFMCRDTFRDLPAHTGLVVTFVPKVTLRNRVVSMCYQFTPIVNH
jgi:hypothetical protein